MIRRPPRSTLFPYTTSSDLAKALMRIASGGMPMSAMIGAFPRNNRPPYAHPCDNATPLGRCRRDGRMAGDYFRSEEHTSELQSRRDLVCRLLLEKKNNKRAH